MAEIIETDPHVVFGDHDERINVGQLVVLTPANPTEGSQKRGDIFDKLGDAFPYIRKIFSDESGDPVQGVRLGIAEGAPVNGSVEAFEEIDLLFRGRPSEVARVFGATVGMLLESAVQRGGFTIARASQDQYSLPSEVRIEKDEPSPISQNEGRPIKKRVAVSVRGSRPDGRSHSIDIHPDATMIVTGAVVWGANGETFGENARPNRRSSQRRSSAALATQKATAERIAAGVNRFSGRVLHRQ